MRALGAFFVLFLLLPGCKTSDGTPVMTDGSLCGAVAEMQAPGSTYRRRESEDDARCQQFGFRPGTEGYGRCRIERDKIRAGQEPVTVTVR